MDEFAINQWMPFWTRNAAENYQIIPRDPRLIKTLTHLKNIAWGKMAAILASGPSLDDALPYLKDFRGLIFAGNSTVNPCIANGIKPDWVHVLDADEYIPKQFIDINTQEMKVIFPSYVHSDVAKLFRPELTWWFNVYDYRHWFMKEGLHYLFPNLDGMLASSNCPAGMIRLAHWMGIRKIYLLGADGGFPGGVQRCSIYQKENGEWIKAGMDEYCIDKSAIEVIDGIQTTIKLRVSMANMVDIIKSLPDLEVINCSRGLLTEIPQKSFKEEMDGH